MAFETQVIRRDGNVWDLAVFVPSTEVELLALSNERRVVCTLNNAYSFQCGLMHSGDGNFFINLNKEVRTQTGLGLGDSVKVSLQADTSEYGMPLPDELATAWNLDPEASALFHQLTKGKQRNLIYLVGKMKSSEKRIEKALIILDYLKSVNGNLDFKELNAALKAAKLGR